MVDRRAHAPAGPEVREGKDSSSALSSQAKRMRHGERAMATGGKQARTQLAKKATAKGLWFYSRLLKHWWSPDELQAIYTARSFRQDAGHFLLRDPTERLREFDETIAALRAERSCF